MQSVDSIVRSENRGTLAGAAAVLMWSSLAALAASTRGIPPFELLAATFGVACVSGLAWLSLRGERLTGAGAFQGLRLRKDAAVYLAATTCALFGYHALYFEAMALAPPATVSLIAYLWP